MGSGMATNGNGEWEIEYGLAVMEALNLQKISFDSFTGASLSGAKVKVNNS